MKSLSHIITVLVLLAFLVACSGSGPTAVPPPVTVAPTAAFPRNPTLETPKAEDVEAAQQLFDSPPPEDTSTIAILVGKPLLVIERSGYIRGKTKILNYTTIDLMANLTYLKALVDSYDDPNVEIHLVEGQSDPLVVSGDKKVYSVSADSNKDMFVGLVNALFVSYHLGAGSAETYENLMTLGHDIGMLFWSVIQWPRVSFEDYQRSGLLLDPVSKQGYILTLKQLYDAGIWNIPIRLPIPPGQQG